MATPRMVSDSGEQEGTQGAVSGRYRLSHLGALEAQSIHIFREVAAEFERPVLLFSGGKDSIVMLHVAKKAFWPAPVPFPVMHIDTGRNFTEVLEFRDRHVAALGVRLEVARVQDDIDAGRTVEDTSPGRDAQPPPDADPAPGHRRGTPRRGLRRCTARRGEGAGQGAHLQFPGPVRPMGSEEAATGALEHLQRPAPQG